MASPCWLGRFGSSLRRATVHCGYVLFMRGFGRTVRRCSAQRRWSHGSPDQAAYINYQTAHALYIRAWLEENPAGRSESQIMNAIVMA
jgi:hypothetical protein